MDSKSNAKQLPPGVECHGNKIRVWFMWQGERCRETLPLTQTPANIQRAGRLRSEIKQLIDLGVFSQTHYLKFFPECSRFAVNHDELQFGQLAQEYLDNVEVSVNTRNEYRKLLNRYWMPELAGRDITSIRYSELRQLVNSFEWSTMKTRNNALTPLRGVFELAYLDEVIDSNPADRLRNMKHQKPLPDPFTREEMEQIIEFLYQELSGIDLIYAHYFEIAFWTGMRTSELIALEWSDIDFRRRYAQVEKAQSKGTLNRQTKTAILREVSLNDRAIQALKTLKSLTAGNTSGRLFIAPQTMEPITSDQAPSRTWRKALKKLGVRYRKAYNTRHTFATIHLMAGVNPALIAKQLGNSIIMVTTTYAKWITSDRDQEELNRVNHNLPLKKAAD